VLSNGNAQEISYISGALLYRTPTQRGLLGFFCFCCGVLGQRTRVEEAGFYGMATMSRLPTFVRTLQHTATHCNTLQHTATHCNTLQHTATHCNTLQQVLSNGSNATPDISGALLLQKEGSFSKVMFVFVLSCFAACLA